MKLLGYSILVYLGMEILLSIACVMTGVDTSDKATAKGMTRVSVLVSIAYFLLHY